MRRSAKNVATVGVLAALQLIFLAAGYYLDVISGAMNVLCSLAIMLTMKRKIYRETVIGYFAVSVVAFLWINVAALPYALFTAPFTIWLCWAQDKGVNKIWTLPVKMAWANGAFYLLYKILGFIIIDFSELGFTLDYWVLVTIVCVAVVGYEIILKYLYKYAGYYANKFLGKE